MVFWRSWSTPPLGKRVFRYCRRSDVIEPETRDRGDFSGGEGGNCRRPTVEQGNNKHTNEHRALVVLFILLSDIVSSRKYKLKLIVQGILFV